jgi:uncharacterized protein YciI
LAAVVWSAGWMLTTGHLEVLMWARANGCPWCEQTCRAAVRGAHLAVLQWARANGCPWGSLTVTGARALMEAEELDEEDPLYEAEDAYNCRPEQTAERREAVEAVVVWLRANGCPEVDAQESSDDEDENEED